MDASKSSQKVPTEVSSVAGRELASCTKEREVGGGGERLLPRSPGEMALRLELKRMRDREMQCWVGWEGSL